MLDAKTSLNITMNTDAVEDTRTQEQKEMLKITSQAGMALQLSLAKGGTGGLRPVISDAEFTKRKNKRNASKKSRKANR